MSLREHLLKIRDEHGKLTPEVVELQARDPDDLLHPRLEWDDTIAGYEYRLVQAAEIIRSVRIVYKEATDKAPARYQRAFVAPRAPDKPHEYVPVEEVARDPFMRTLLLRQMDREWKQLKQRYAQFDEFWRMVAEDPREETG